MTCRMLLWLVSAVFLLNCGSDSNFNQIWGKDDESADALLLEAKLNFDQGNYTKAQELAEKVYNRNNNIEEAAVLLGYIYMSTGGIELFKMLREMTKLSATGATLTTSSTATSQLTTLSKALLNLSEDDFNALGTPYEGKSTLFSGTDQALIVPNVVNDELRAKVSTLSSMNTAIKYICRFVDHSGSGKATSENDPRHNATECAETTETRRLRGKAHFLWALTHLTESLVYQSVLLYTTGSGTETNFQARANALQGQDFGTNITGFLAAVEDMQAATDAIFSVPTKEGDVSMLSATLSNLSTFVASLEGLGVPSDFISPIKSSMTQIESQAKAIGTQVGSFNDQVTALKGEMTQKFASTVGTKINEAEAKFIKESGLPEGTSIKDLKDQAEYADEVKEFESLCTSYNTLADGVAAGSKTIPNACK